MEKLLDLKNEGDLHANSGAKIDEIWSIYVTPTPANYDPVACVSINLFRLNLTGYQIFIIFNNNTSIRGFFVFASEPYQFNPNRGDTDDFDLFPTRTQKMMKIRMQRTERKPTRKYECDELNQQKYSECIEKYIIEKLRCKPSWFQIFSNKSVCSGSEKYQEYLALIRDLKKSDCIAENCVQNTWNTQEMWTTSISNIFGDGENYQAEKFQNGTWIQYLALATTVKVSEEAFTYGIFDIFNDFAGVLSLLLGVSIISFYDYIVETSMKIYDSFKK